jgi:hypothetical protein
MILRKGFILGDIYYFKNIITAGKKIDDKKKFKNSGNFKKIFQRKNFINRRKELIDLWLHPTFSNSDFQFYPKSKIYESKIYEKSGLFVFSTNFFICFKILKKKVRNSFFLRKIKIFLSEKIGSKNLIYIIERFDLLGKDSKENLKSFKKKNRNNFNWIFIAKKTRELIKHIQKKPLFKKNLHFEIIQSKNNFNLVKVKKFLKKKEFFSSIQKAIYCPFRSPEMNIKFISSLTLEKVKVEEKFTILFRLLWLKLLMSSGSIKFECLNIFIINSINVRNNLIFFDRRKSSGFSFFPPNVLKKNIKKQHLFLIFLILLYLKT